MQVLASLLDDCSVDCALYYAEYSSGSEAVGESMSDVDSAIDNEVCVYHPTSTVQLVSDPPENT